jgi:hypothetical protein
VKFNTEHRSDLHAMRLWIDDEHAVSTAFSLFFSANLVLGFFDTALCVGARPQSGSNS